MKVIGMLAWARLVDLEDKDGRGLIVELEAGTALPVGRLELLLDRFPWEDPDKSEDPAQSLELARAELRNATPSI